MGTGLDRWRLRYRKAKHALHTLVFHPVRLAFGEEKVDAAIARIENDLHHLETAIEHAIAKTLFDWYGEAAHLREEYGDLAVRLRHDLTERYGLEQLRGHVRYLRSL